MKKRDKSQPRDKKLENLLKKFFAFYDADQSGYLDKDEIQKLMNDACIEMGIQQAEEEEVNEMIKFYDESGDGKFDFDETYDMIAPFVEDQIE